MHFKIIINPLTMHLSIAQSPEELNRCFPVIQQLRTHLSQTEFVEQVQRQQQQGYQLLYVEDDGEVKALAGFRVSEALAWGKFLYVDDLVTLVGDRSKGYGQALFDWLLDYAKQEGCQQFSLDSGVQRFDAHRFYFRQRMAISSYHFSLKV